MMSFNDFAKDFGNKPLVYKLQKFLEYQEDTIKAKDARIKELNIKCDEKSALLAKTSCEVNDLYRLSVKRKEKIRELEAENEKLKSIESVERRLSRVQRYDSQKKRISTLESALLDFWGYCYETCEDPDNPHREHGKLIKEIKEKYENIIND